MKSLLRCHTVKGYHEFSRDPTPHRDLRHCVGDAGCHLRTPTASFRSIHPPPQPPPNMVCLSLPA